MIWKDALSGGWGEVKKNTTVDWRPLTLKGKNIEGLGAHSLSYAEYDVPEGYDRFEAKGMMTPGGGEAGGFEFLVLLDPPKQTLPPQSEITVELKDLGIAGKARVRDLWTGEDLGLVEDKFRRNISLHASGLYRLSPFS
jgi:hypothetical protein